MEERGPKRHCMVVYACYPLGETRVQREAEALVSHGFDVDVICLRTPDEAPAVDSHRGVRIYREPFRFPVHLGKMRGDTQQFLNYLRFFASAAMRLTQLHRQEPYDTVQVHNVPDFLVFCALIPKLSGVSVILDLHDLMPELYAGRFGQDRRSLPRRVILWQESQSCRFADHIITVSEHWRQALIERGVPAHKCSVVMNVADHNIFHPPKDGCPRSSNNSQLRMVYHGTIVDRYGMDLVIRAMAKVRHDLPNIHLTILGRGPHVPTLIQFVHELGLEEHVALRDEIRPVEELPGIIRTADVGIVPYRNDVFTDGLLPTKLMEYAALGLPAIAARTTAIEAYFGDSMVEFFEPGDVDDLARCIRMLYEDRERLAELARGSAKFNRRYNWTKISAKYVALVERLGSQ
jgi:glycosyltransferase involved in cell wall biosynthesis